MCNIYIYIYGIKLQIFFSRYIAIPDVTPQSALLGFTDTSTEHLIKHLIKHLLLIYKRCLYKARDSQNLSFLAFKNNIIKETKFLKKWQIINNDAVVIIIFSLQNPMIPIT